MSCSERTKCRRNAEGTKGGINVCIALFVEPDFSEFKVFLDSDVGKASVPSHKVEFRGDDAER